MNIIVAAAVKLSTKEGCYWVGKSHREARGVAIASGLVINQEDFVSGFIDITGNWLTREEAYVIAKANGQMKSEPLDYGPGKLDSDSVNLSEEGLAKAKALQTINNNKFLL